MGFTLAEEQKISRRRYLKYVGGAVGVAIVAGAGYGLYESTKPPPTPGLTTSSLTTAGTTTPAIVKGGTMIYDSVGSVASLDPVVIYMATETEAVFHLYQPPLAYKDNTTDVIVPLLAENYTVSDDGLTHTLNMRKGIKFHNGDPLNAYCLWYSTYRAGVMNLMNGWYNRGFLGDYPEKDGVTDSLLNEWSKPDNTPPDDQMELVTGGKSAITCPDSYTAVFRLPKRSWVTAALLTQQGMYVMDPLWVTQNGGVKKSTPNSYLVDHANGSGPFRLKEHTPNVRLVLDRDPNYWGGPGTGVHDTPKLDEVIVRYVPDALTRLGDVERGAAHVTGISDVEIVAEKPGSTYIPSNMPKALSGVGYISFNTKRPPFDNKLVRQAALRAIDWNSLKKLTRGFESPFVPLVPDGVPGRDPALPYYEQDVEGAKSLLTQAGNPNGKGLPEASLLYWTDRGPLNGKISELVQANLGDVGLKVVLVGRLLNDVIGIACNSAIKPEDRVQYYDLIWVSWNWFPDPWCFADWWATDLGFYSWGSPGFYINPDVVNLIAKANAASTSEERIQHYYEASRIAVDDAPMIPATQNTGMMMNGVPIFNVKAHGFSWNLSTWGTMSFCQNYLTE